MLDCIVLFDIIAPMKTAVPDTPPGLIAPVAPSSRIAILDVLRGFAMLGVLWSNLYVWYGCGGNCPGAFDSALQWMQDWLIDNRFYTLLGLLFGVGFTLQMDRVGVEGAETQRVFLRRMAVLFLLGAFHGTFLWWGDVLAWYAVLGILLLPFRRLSQRNLVIAAAVVFFVVPYVLRRVVGSLGLASPWTFGTNPASREVYIHGSVGEIALQRMADYWHSLYTWFSRVNWAQFLTTMLVGMIIVRSGVLRKLKETGTAWLWRSVLAFAALFALGEYWSEHFDQWWPLPPPGTGSYWSPRGIAGSIGPSLIETSEALIYACLLALLWLRPVGANLLRPLAAVGRMPVTTYLTQSLVCTTLFYGYGFGLWGRANAATRVGIALALFTLQMGASVWWLRHFRFGPVEWLWRSMSYGRTQQWKEN